MSNMKCVYTYSEETIQDQDGNVIVQKYQVIAKKEVKQDCPLDDNEVETHIDIDLHGSLYEPDNKRFVDENGNVLLEL